MSAGWEGGSTRRYREQRDAVLTRDRVAARRTGEPWCRARVPGVCVGQADPMHAHHVHGRSSGCKGCEADDPRHMIATCPPCNLHIGDPSKTADPAVTPITQWG